MMRLYLRTLGIVCMEFMVMMVTFPVWWYSKGLVNIAAASFNRIQDAGTAFHLRILFANLLQPMYGMRDWVSRVISFFVRLVHLTLLLLLLGVWAQLHILFVFAWLLLPPLVVLQIIYQKTGVPPSFVFSLN